MRLFFTYFLLIGMTGIAQENGGRGTIRVGKSHCTLVKGSDSVYAEVDEMPEFPGGQEKMLKWMDENLKYPGGDSEEQHAATIFVSFVVEATGEIGDVTIFKSDKGPFEVEALRLIRSMPKWKPGICNKKKVPVKVNYPIRFGLK